MENVNIRKATENDLPVLLAFEQEIVKTERPFDPTIKEGSPHYYDLLHLIRVPHAEVLVAELDGEPVASGYAVIRTAQPYLKHESFAYLGFMYVKPEHRGRGIIQAIVESLAAWAASRHITEIRLEVYEQNIPARKAYEKVGFKANLLEMRMDIGRK